MLNKTADKDLMPTADRTRLIEQELDALYQVSRVLNSSLQLRDKLQGILEVLHERAGMRSGMLALREKTPMLWWFVRSGKGPAARTTGSRSVTSRGKG